jgi:hypothetical protein
MQKSSQMKEIFADLYHKGIEVEFKSASHGGHKGREFFGNGRVTRRVRAVTTELRRR